MKKFNYYKKIALNTPIYILIPKIIKKIFNKFKDSYVYLKALKNGTSLSDDVFLNELGLDSKAISYKKYFYGRVEKNTLFNVMINDMDKHFIINSISEKNKIIKLAKDVCRHEFDLLGSGKERVSYELESKGIENYLFYMNISGKKLKEIKEKIKNKVSFLINKCNSKSNTNHILDINYEPINWHVDFISGYMWSESIWYKNIRYGLKHGMDIKVPWELSRFQHLITLGQAYVITGDEKYSLEYIYQITDWIENNPPRFGVNWRCTMDVAIRAANWILSLSFFKNSKLITNEFLFYFIKNIYVHGKHIINNLEYGLITSNHYLSDISGLLFISELFSEFDIGKKWKKFAINELKKEMAKQVYDDGVDFEASTCYHRLVLELFFYCTLFTIKNSPEFEEDNFIEFGKNIFGKEYIKKLYKMFEFTLYALKPSRKMPQIGDNDNGRFFIFGNREILDMRYLLTLGAIFFREAKFKVEEFGFCEEALWVFGEKGYKIWQSLKENSLANIASKAFPDVGWYIMRNDKDYMIISCGPNGQNGDGGHCHNDKLSFELYVDGKDAIVDSGTYVYTSDPEARNRFRGTAYHNTVMVDDKEQNRFDKHSVFRMNNDALTGCLEWKTGNEVDLFIGEHYGYKRLSQPVIHKREIKYYKKDKKWEIIDRFEGKGEHDLEWNLILSPEFKQELKISSDKLQWHREPAFYSSEYGTTTNTEKLISILKTTIPVKVKFCIEILNENAQKNI